MTVNTVMAAWEAADKIFPTDYTKDDVKSTRAGYSIYSSTVTGNGSYICDLGNRLEINLETGESINIWIDPTESEKSPEIRREKTICLESSTTSTRNAGATHIKRICDLTLSEDTQFTAIAQFEREAQKIIRAARKATKNGEHVDVSLAVGVYEISAAGNVKQASFEHWNGSGFEIAAEGVHLSPDMQYNADKTRDFWLTGAAGRLWDELTI